MANPELKVEKKAEAKVDAPKALAEPSDGLVKMKKDDEILRVHQTCVKSHEGAGWKIVN